EVKRLIRKGPWAGKATLTAIGKLLAKHPWPTQAPPRKTAAAPNQTVADCRDCRQPVQPGEGVQDRDARGYRYVKHRQCPPRPALRNAYPGTCKICLGWVDVEEGVLTECPAGLVVVHDGTCPPVEQRKSPPPIPNRYTEPCALCWQLVPAGTGVYAHGAVTHTEN